MKERKTNRRPGLNAFTLRIIAFVAMTVGCAQVFTENHEVDWKIYMFYFSYTIFAFLMVEDIKHSQDRWAYLRRLVVFALIAEVPGDLLFCGTISDNSQQSIMLTLLIAFIVMNALDLIRVRVKNMIVTFAAALLLCWLGTLACRALHTELADFGIIIACILYLSSNVTYTRLMELVCFAAIVVYITADNYLNILIDDLYYSVPDKFFALLAVILTWFYNGERGPNKLWIKVVYYLYFPLMLLILWLIKTYALG